MSWGLVFLRWFTARVPPPTSLRRRTLHLTFAFLTGSSQPSLELRTAASSAFQSCLSSLSPSFREGCLNQLAPVGVSRGLFLSCYIFNGTSSTPLTSHQACPPVRRFWAYYWPFQPPAAPVESSLSGFPVLVPAWRTLRLRSAHSGELTLWLISVGSVTKTCIGCRAGLISIPPSAFLPPFLCSCRYTSVLLASVRRYQLLRFWILSPSLCFCCLACWSWQCNRRSQATSQACLPMQCYTLSPYGGRRCSPELPCLVRPSLRCI